METWIKFIRKHLHANRILLLLLVFYFFFRLIHLTAIPMWNDESIYLDWGWRETHVPGYLYYSLYDAKQPLEFWLFGIAESILSDPLFAGRFISVLFGCATLIGLYFLTKQLLNKKTALLASGIYIIIPIFSFYDRQAFVESAISAVGVWSIYLLYNTILRKSRKYAVWLGVVLGIGLFCKSTTVIFVVLSCLLIFFIEKDYQRELELLLYSEL
jgi:4-amino-4-deoxy-L-arabinose transferase-like glycosyltransferase